MEEERSAELARKEGRILRVLLYKLGQMQPAMANLLVIRAPQELVQSSDLAGLMQVVKILVERKDPAFYALSRYSGPAAFYKDFMRLSGILLWSASAQVWVNKQARPALDEKVLRLVGNLLGG